MSRQRDVAEIANFIIHNDPNKRLISTIEHYYWNFLKHIDRLHTAGQILTQRNKSGNLIGVLGWIRIKSIDERQINKITWKLPDNISTGNIMYITFSVVSNGKLNLFRREINKMFDKNIDEICWFSAPHDRFFRKKNIRKGEKHAIG